MWMSPLIDNLPFYWSGSVGQLARFLASALQNPYCQHFPSDPERFWGRTSLQVPKLRKRAAVDFTPSSSLASKQLRIRSNDQMMLTTTPWPSDLTFSSKAVWSFIQPMGAHKTHCEATRLAKEKERELTVETEGLRKRSAELLGDLEALKAWLTAAVL